MSRSEDTIRRDERRSAWSDAKLAVRCYARDPSDANAGRVNRAWRKVRRTMTTAIGRRIERKSDGMPINNRMHHF